MGTGEPALLARIRRAGVPGYLDGYVVGAGTSWVCLALEDDLALNGYTLIRRADITRVRRPSRRHALVERVLTSQGEWPVPLPPALELDETGQLFTSLAEHWPVVSIYTEGGESSGVNLGVPVRVRRDALVLHEIRYTGEWYDELTVWPLARISRVDVGDGYATRIFAAAPTRLSERPPQQGRPGSR